jgi:L-threonylcarbamoyladenylate synthase
VITAEQAHALQACLEGDGLAIVPTDTVYGIACNPTSQRATDRLYELKGRARGKPSATMFFALEPALAAMTELGPRTRAALTRLLPGPVTVLLPGSDGALVGLRVPSLSGPLAALASVSAAALQSSANLAGGPDPRRLDEVPAQVRDGVELVLDGGELPGAASVVLDLGDYERNGAWRVVREGPLRRERLRELLD